MSDQDKPRLVKAERRQVEMRMFDLESLVEEDHPVRSIWELVTQLDLKKFEETILAREGQAGRAATDPRILVTLWVQAVIDGVGSARELERRCQRDNIYRWICGGVGVNYHTLSDFRTNHSQAIDDLLTQIIATMRQQKLIELKRVAQDGTKIRASAGAASFHRKKTIRDHCKEAKARIIELKRFADQANGQTSEHERAARERVAQERLKRVEAALAQLPKLEAIKQKDLRKNTKTRTEARVSTTDPDARVMKMSHGGFHPAFNVQLAAETKGRVIVGVRVTNQGSDAEQALPMVQEIRRRTGQTPEEYLMDGGLTTRQSVQALSEEGITVYGGLKSPKNPQNDPHEPKPEDTPAYAALRRRMKSEEGKTIYKERGALIETVNADLKEHRKISQFRVRGIDKVTTIVLWAATAYNLLRWISLTSSV